MSTLKNRLTNLLALNRGVFNRIDSQTNDRPATPAQIVREGSGSATQLKAQQVANDKNGRPDWFQAIHGSDD